MDGGWWWMVVIGGGGRWKVVGGGGRWWVVVVALTCDRRSHIRPVGALLVFKPAERVSRRAPKGKLARNLPNQGDS